MKNITRKTETERQVLSISRVKLAFADALFVHMPYLTQVDGGEIHRGIRGIWVYESRR